MTKPIKLLYFITEDWFFCSHFLDRAVAAQKMGFQVSVLTHLNEPKFAEKIHGHGIDIIPIQIERTKFNFLNELRLIKKLMIVYQQSSPDIVHHIAIKPIIFGTLVAKLVKVPHIVNAPVGFGYAFSSNQLKAKIIKPLLLFAFKLLLNPKNSIAIFENPDHQRYFTALNIVKSHRSRLIRGAGVDLGRYTLTTEPQGAPVIMLASRMLWDKGIGQFIQAAKQINQCGQKARFILVGTPDKLNPNAISEQQLQQWHQENTIEWWGHQSNMPEIFKQTHIFCLPTTYSEGLPKVLIEAAAAGKPIVTTNIPGCREVVTDGVNGFLVPGKAIEPLVKALHVLIENTELRQEMGRQGHNKAVREFSNELIARQTLEVYEEVAK